MKRFKVVFLIIAISTIMAGCPLLENRKIRLDTRRPETVTKTLKNGLTVVVEENFGAPVAAVQVWVNAGSADETDGEAGLAHFLEHMVFKGTAKRGVGEVAMEVESLGGDLNAFTSYDRTVFHITLASRYYDRALDILSDLTHNATFDPVEVDREREVVREEIRRGKDNPSSRVYKYLFEKAYREHTYRRPVIGYDDNVKSFTSADLKNFYEKWYVPENMTVVVTGDVDSGRVIRDVEKWFGDFSGPAPSSSPRDAVETVQISPREKVYREDVSEGWMYLGFHIPAFAHEDMAALDVMSVIIGGGETSRLVYRVRTQKRLVSRIWAYAYTPRDPGLFLVGCNVKEDKSREALEQILKQMYVLKHETVDDWELQKAKITLETDSIYSRETVDGQARRLGYYMTLTGDPYFEDKYLEKIKNVTAEDIKKAAKKYFSGQNLTAVAIMPDKNSNSHSIDEQKVNSIIRDVDKWDSGYSIGSLNLSRPDPPEIPEAEVAPSEKGGIPLYSPPEKFVLSNGVKLIVRENHSVPLVSVRAAFKGGLRLENRENNGINNFIADAITKGTVNYTSHEIDSFIEARAGSISGFSGLSSLGVTMELPSQYFHGALPVFADVIRFPTFPSKEVEAEREIIISSIKNNLDQPGKLARRLFESTLYEEHPLGMDTMGTETSVRGLTCSDLRDYYEALSVPGNLVIAVVGDVEAAKVKNDFEKLFKDWAAEPFQPAAAPPEPPPARVREVSECRDVEQTNIIIGFQGLRVTSEDRYPMAVLGSVLSGMSGRLFSTLREKQSLAYGVAAFSTEALDPGFLGVSIGTSPEKEAQATEGLLKELEKARNERVTDEELTRAKEVLIGEYEIGQQKLSTQAANYALDELYGMGYEEADNYARRIESVTAADVQRAAEKYLKENAHVIAVVRPCGFQAKAEVE